MPKKKILVVDDEKLLAKIVSDELEALGYDVTTVHDGESALKAAHEIRPDTIILDVIMPGMDGFEVCKCISDSKSTEYIPVIMLTALTDKESRHKGLEAGAIDFLSKPVDVTELAMRLRNVIKLKEYQDFLEEYNEKLEMEVAEKTQEIKDSFIDTICRLTLAAEHKDKCTASHLKRVSYYVSFLAKSLGYSDAESEVMFHASPMHDVGKIGVPDEILLKEGKLTFDEYDVMKRHTLIGAKLLSDSKSEYLMSAAKFALYHHENWDGTGYPHGLKGEEIPVEGRIMLMADRYDALRSARPYKGAFSHDKAFSILTGANERTAVAHFDPIVLEAFRDNHQEFDFIYNENREDAAFS